MKKAIWGLAIVAAVLIGIVVIMIVGGLFAAKGGLANVLPPNPVIVSASDNTGGSTLTDYCRTIVAQIRNDGGSGDVVVEITYSEGARSWTKSRRESFTTNETKSVSMVFNEATLGGEGKYHIAVR
ncbi:MAG: hypothetical protein V1701_02860 [Planctomycetota bacterium]